VPQTLCPNVAVGVAAADVAVVGVAVVVAASCWGQQQHVATASFVMRLIRFS